MSLAASQPFRRNSGTNETGVRMAFDRRRLLQVGAAGALSAPFISRRGFAADEPIKVGSLLDQSGPIGTSGTPMYYAAQVAVSEINAAGGVWAAHSNWSIRHPIHHPALLPVCPGTGAERTRSASSRAASPRPPARPSDRCSIATRSCISTTCCTKAASATATFSVPAPHPRRR